MTHLQAGRTSGHADSPSALHPSDSRHCAHVPACPSADAADRDAAHVVSAHPEQGWSLLCNGVVVFDDFGELLPNGQCIAARRAALLMASPHRKAS